jgi:dTDP-4-amino-4,6-dideoxygalactose transaminase
VIRLAERDALRQRLRAAGIGTGVHYPVPVHLQPAYRDRCAVGPSDLGLTERAARQILSLPMYPQLSDAEVDQVISEISEFFAN